MTLPSPPPPPTHSNQNEKDHNLPSTISLFLLIIESLSHYREESKLIEAEHAVQADFCPESSDNAGHLGTLTGRFHLLGEGWHVGTDG